MFDPELPQERESEDPDPAPELGVVPDELPQERESDGLALLGRLLVDGLDPLGALLGGAVLGPQPGPPPGRTITGPPQPKPKGR